MTRAPILLILAAVPCLAAELKPYNRYIHDTEARLATKPFLWVDASPERLRIVRHGQVAAEPWKADGDTFVPGASIHDWVGAIFIPGGTLGKTSPCCRTTITTRTSTKMCPNPSCSRAPAKTLSITGCRTVNFMDKEIRLTQSACEGLTPEPVQPQNAFGNNVNVNEKVIIKGYGVSVVATPEPGSRTLVVLGLGLIAFVSRKLRK